MIDSSTYAIRCAYDNFLPTQCSYELYKVLFLWMFRYQLFQFQIL